MTAPSDPIRAEVERRLTQVTDVFVVRPFEQLLRLGGLVSAPCRLVRSRLAEPIAVLRSIADVAFGPGPDTAVVSPDGTDRTPTAAQSVGEAEEASTEAPAPGDLPVAEYESLAASQVVARLDDLTRGELRRVRAFEAANRGRRTVLGKIDQLLAAH